MTMHPATPKDGRWPAECAPSAHLARTGHRFAASPGDPARRLHGAGGLAAPPPSAEQPVRRWVGLAGVETVEDGGEERVVRRRPLEERHRRAHLHRVEGSEDLVSGLALDREEKLGAL